LTTIVKAVYPFIASKYIAFESVLTINEQYCIIIFGERKNKFKSNFKPYYKCFGFSNQGRLKKGENGEVNKERKKYISEF